MKSQGRRCQDGNRGGGQSHKSRAARGHQRLEEARTDSPRDPERAPSHLTLDSSLQNLRK